MPALQVLQSPDNDIKIWLARKSTQKTRATTFAPSITVQKYQPKLFNPSTVSIGWHSHRRECHDKRPSHKYALPASRTLSSREQSGAVGFTSGFRVGDLFVTYLKNLSESFLRQNFFTLPNLRLSLKQSGTHSL